METPSFTEISALTEEQARAYLERVRWPERAACVHCGDTNVARLGGKAGGKGQWKCRGCRGKFTVTTGTIFHASHISLRQWLMAFSLICSSKKGISALQLQRMLDLKSYKSAWHLAHRVRHAMRSEPLAGMLKGTVEADETWIGGKPRVHQKQGKPKIRDKWTSKVPVMVLVDRDGPAVAFPVERVNAANLKGAVDRLVEKGSTVYTDEHRSYRGLGQAGYSHDWTTHSKGEYLRGNVHSNTAESYFALLKRGVHGSFHHVSAKLLPRYCDEFSFRWGHRKASDAERTLAALKQTEGKRLAYRAAVVR